MEQVSLHLRPGGATWAWPDGTRVTLRFQGAQPTTRLKPVAPVTQRVDQRTGRAGAQRSDAGTRYAAVRYEALWPGIDLLFRAEGPALKYEFRVAPGANPEQIQLEWEGPERLSLNAEGELLLHGPGWLLTDLAPLAWQPASVHLAAPEGSGRQSAVAQSEDPGRPVPVAYEIGEGTTFGFTLRGYEVGRPLVIDPELRYVPSHCGDILVEKPHLT